MTRELDLSSELAEARRRLDELEGAAQLVDRIEREYTAFEQTLAALRATARS